MEKERDIIGLLEQMRKVDKPRINAQNESLQHPKSQRSLTDKQKYLRRLM